MKPTHLLIAKTGSTDFLSVNTQDVKTVTIHPSKECGTVVTSTSRLNLTCLTTHRLNRLYKELRDRYTFVHLSASGASADAGKHDNALVVVENGDEKTFIWPKALFAISKEGETVTVEAFGKMKLTFQDPRHRVTAEFLKRHIQGLVKA